MTSSLIVPQPGEVRRRKAHRLLLAVGAMAFLLVLAAPAPTYAEDETVEELLARMDELLALEELTEAQQNELLEVIDRYEAALAKQDGGTEAAPKPTPTPRATPRPRRTPKPRVTPTPRPTSKPSSTRATSSRGGSRAKPRTGKGAPAKTPAAGDPGVPVIPELNVDADRFLKPYDQRTYEIGMEDVPYADLIKQFARMAGLEVYGDAPEGEVSLVTTEPMDFKAIMNRLQLLLFDHPDKYWIKLQTDEGARPYLKIFQVRDQRDIDLPSIFTSVETYREANLEDNDVALLLYAPAEGSIADLEPLRDFMPDYFLVAPYPGQNAVYIIALVRDIDKYLQLIDRFRLSTKDPRERKIIPVENLEPSAALEILKTFVDGFDARPGAPASKRRAGQDSVAAAEARGVDAEAFDERGVLFVVAMPNKIAEIEEFLAYIDVPLGDEFAEPVIVKMKHAEAAKVLTMVQAIVADDATPTRRTSSTAKRPRGKRAKTKQPAATAKTDDLVMLEWPEANAIVLLGDDENVARAKTLIERFDVPDNTVTEFVAIEHREPADLVALVSELLPELADDFVCSPDDASSSVLLSGSPANLAVVKDLLAKLDQPAGVQDEVHTIKVENVTPSSLIGILSAYESATEGTPAPARSTSKAKERAKARRSTARRSGGAGNKFQANDEAGVLHVICTADEWEDTYKPLIEQLDRELVASSDYTVLPLEHLDADDAITDLQQAFPVGKGKSGAKYIAVPEGVMVFGAAPADVEGMRQILALKDVADVEVRRIFELQFVDPEELVTILQSALGENTPRPRRTTKGKAPAATGSDVRYVPHGSKLWVWAPTREMEQITELIAELDVPEGEDREMRGYEFAVGTNVNDFANVLRQFFPATGRVAATTDAKGKRRTNRRTAAKPLGDEDVLIVPQPETRKIFVSAPVAMFEEIEATIDSLRPDVLDRPGVAYEFFAVENAEPDVIAGLIQPIMQAKIDEMLATGELPEPAAKNKTPLNITPDAVGKRIIVTAPRVLMPEIASLIEKLEAGEYADTVVRRVTLKNASADEMATTVRAMISGQTAPPRRRAPRNRGGKQGAGAAAPVSASTPSGVTVVAAPGDDALVLTGPGRAVDEVEGWIEMLDEGATGGKTMMKVYQLVYADVEEMADIIMTVFDTAPKGRAAKPNTAPDDMWEIDLGGPRKGGIISLTTNYYSNTMIVWTNPRTMAEIDDLIELYEGREVSPQTADLPKALIDLDYADAFDAKYELEEIIDAYWDSDKPKIDYIPFQNTLVVKSRNLEADLPQVRDLVAKYIDKESERDRVAFEAVSITGAEPQDIARLLLLRLPADLDVEVEGLTDDSGSELVETLKPVTNRCVLPSGLTRSIDMLIAGAVAQDAGDAGETESPKPAAEPTPAPAKPTEAELIAEVLGDKPDADKTPNKPKRKLKVRINPRTGQIEFEGPPKDVADAKYELEMILDRVKPSSAGPDIRVLRLKYLDPNVATEVLQAMFGAGGSSRAAGNRAAQAAARAKAMQEAMKKMAAGNQPNQANPDEGGDEGGRSGRRGNRRGEKEEEPAAQPAVAASPSIQVVPFPSLNAIIVKAPTEMYPRITELLATIDRKSDSPDSDFRFFKIQNQLASDVEKQLKTILGVDEPQRSTRRSQPRGRGGQQNAAASAVEELMRQQIDLAMAGMEGETASAASISITSNDASNTVLVRGPRPILDLAEEIIAKIEENAPEPKQEVTYALKYAESSVVVPHLQKLFAENSGRGATYHPDDVRDAVFIADTLNNAVIVRALADDLPKIETAIAKIDLPPTQENKPRFIKLQAAKPSIVARTINETMDFSTKSGSRVRVTGDDTSTSLIVVAPEAVFTEIEAFAKQLDAPPDELRIEVYELKFAKANDVLRKMNDMVRSLLQQIRGKNIQLDTFTAQADERANSIIVMGGPITHGLVTQVIAKLDVESADTSVETLVVMLKRARARDVANNINRLFSGRNDGFDPPKAEANDTTNTLFVRGTKSQLDEIRRDVISQVEDQPKQESREARVYQVEFADLNGVRGALTTSFRLEHGAADTERVDVAVESATRSLVVTAKPSKHEEIAKLIAELDTDTGASTIVRNVYTMVDGKASQVADIIARSMRETRRGRQGPPVSVVPNDDLNMLVITSTQKDYEEYLPLVKQLDQPPLEGGLEPRVYPLKFADPSSLIGTIHNSFPRLRGQRPEDIVKASYTWGTASLIVTASAENHEKVKKLIAEIDIESTVERTTHVIPLEEANAEELARHLTHILNRTQRRRRDDQGMAVVADPGTNTLLVFANETELKKVQDLVTTLDVKPKFDREIRSFKLLYAEVWPTYQAITEFFGRSSGRRMSPKDQVAVVVDYATNSLVVSAAPKKLEEVAAFVEQIDQKGAAGREIHVVQLKNTDPDGVVRSLVEIFVQRSRRGEQNISITSPRGSDALIIKANEQEYADILAVVEQLDVLPSDEDRNVQRFTLKYIDAGAMQTVIEDYMTKPGGRRGRGGAELLGDMRITTIPTSNSIVVSGAADGLERVAGLVEELDVEVEDAGTAPKIIELENALASEVEPTLTKMFVDAVRRQRGRNQTSTIETVIVADDASNSLIVRASAADYSLIEDLARRMDSIDKDDSANFRLIQVAAAFRVADLAPTIEESLRQAVPQSAQSGRGRGGRRSDVSVEPILASNSLLIAGDPKYLDVAEALIAKIQANGPAGKKRSIIINTENMSAEEIKRVIDGMIDQNNSQGSRRSNRRGRRR